MRSISLEGVLLCFFYKNCIEVIMYRDHNGKAPSLETFNLYYKTEYNLWHWNLTSLSLPLPHRHREPEEVWHGPRLLLLGLLLPLLFLLGVVDWDGRGLGAGLHALVRPAAPVQAVEAGAVSEAIEVPGKK